MCQTVVQVYVKQRKQPDFLEMNYILHVYISGHTHFRSRFHQLNGEKVLSQSSPLLTINFNSQKKGPKKNTWIVQI